MMKAVGRMRRYTLQFSTVVVSHAIRSSVCRTGPDVHRRRERATLIYERKHSTI